ncbi:tRNA(Met) cytidine acetyltransferase TmcA [Providencia stuartii]|uniref:tRNA(Met) cytidine acetyltransferase TmcA n=1 Tax=Providencia stuartii TaxID=588 RepID=UPI0018C48E13|nr:GNAT family N-acetyltransferase [Providencia stuartii]MBG5918528.1 tRNA(Met) cytidine acetyltransferase [Providencia stuartii]
MNDSLPEICAQLSDYGYRRLLVLSGESQWVVERLQEIQSTISGDWLTLSSTMPNALPVKSAHLLLGREFLHAVFDAREGLHSEALAMLAGTLKAGSLLILCTPAQHIWADTLDSDSLRWNEQNGAIATPNFVHHLQRVIKSRPDVLLWQQYRQPYFSRLPEQAHWQAPSGEATAAQQIALNQLLAATSGVWGVIAPRGRGKSTLAGMLIQKWQGKCWCCAPAKVAIQTLEKYAGGAVSFFSPDELLRYCLKDGEIDADWLIIDEAAAIPNYILRQLVSYFPRVLLTTTVEGYEGTGRGFINKFCSHLDNFTSLHLAAPIRWAENDPLENWLNQALLLEETDISTETHPVCLIEQTTQQQLADNPEQLKNFYGLLTSAHYRTSPLDLRRLLDASQQQFMTAKSSTQLVGALWMVEEGSLDHALSWQVWAGLRRPRGNLLVQSLAAHSYFPEAAQMRSQRTMRIAVAPAYRRQKIGLQLLAAQKHLALEQGRDFLSVSFGLTPELLSFWQQAGYRLVRVGSHLEASSGCYTAMAILPLSAKASLLCEQAERCLSKDLFWRKDLSHFNLPFCEQQHLSDEDWLELVGFAFYHRTLEASSAAIQRLLTQHEGGLLLLRFYFQLQLSLEEICQQLQLAGQKAWLKQARAELKQCLQRDYPELVEMVAQKTNLSCF